MGGHPSTDRGGPVAVGGFSAGGTLAASAALQARDLGSCTPALQLLGVPSLDVAEDGATSGPRGPSWTDRAATATG